MRTIRRGFTLVETIGGNRNYWNFGGVVTPRRAVGARSRSANAVQQQCAQSGVGSAQLSRCSQRLSGW